MSADRPDYYYNSEDWECTSSDIQIITDDLPLMEIMEVGCLKSLPVKYAAHVVKTWHEGEPDETEVELFDTIEEAQAATKRTAPAK